MILDRRLVRTAPVLDFPLWEYEVDENGNVWSFKRREYGMRLEPCRENSSRRPRVSLSRRGEKSRNYYVHVIVCTGFHGPAPSPYHQVHHLDQDTTNNEAGNLAWLEFLEHRRIHRRR